MGRAIWLGFSWLRCLWLWGLTKLALITLGRILKSLSESNKGAYEIGAYRVIFRRAFKGNVSNVKAGGSGKISSLDFVRGQTVRVRLRCGTATPRSRWEEIGDDLAGSRYSKINSITLLPLLVLLLLLLLAFTSFKSE